MNAVAGAAVPVLSSLDSTARVSSNVGLCLSVHSSPSPASLKNLNSRACRYKSRSRRRIAKATASSFSIGLDNEEEELGYSYEGADVLQSVSRRNATRKFEREESASKSRGVKAPFDKHQTRGSFYSENAPTSRKHDRDNAVAYNRERDFPPFEEQQHHGSFWGKKHSRVPLPTKNQCLRMHNKVTVFEGIRQPSVSGLSSNNRTDASSWGVEDADVAPNFDGQPLISHEDSRRRLRYSQCTTQHGFKENIQRSSQFMSKLEEVVSNLKKKDVLSRESFAMNQEVLRDESMQAAINEGKRSKGRGLFEFSKSIEKQSGKFAEFDIKSSAGNANIIIASGGSNVMNDGKDLQNEPGETRSLSKEIASVGNEAAVTSFNLFSSSPAVPWESDRKYVSMFKPHIPIRRGYASPLARRSFRSIGSRSSPSRSSLTNRNDSHLELDSHAATGVLDLSKLIGGDEQMESWFEDREGSELNDDKFTTQTASQKEALEAEERAESINFYQSESDAEENGDNALSMHLSIKESCTEANATTNSSLSASSSNGIVNWDNSDSEVNEDKDFLIKADVEEDVSNEFDFHERSHHSQKNYVYSCDSDVEDAEPPEEVLVSSITHTNAPSAEFPADTNLGVSEMGNGSKHLISASWHKHNLADIPFEFQFSYSETPKVPVLGFRETPYSPFGPDTMGRPWTGGPPPKPSKKKQRVFDSFKPPPKDKKGIKYVQDPGPYPEGQGPKPAQSREEIMGDPLTKEEIVYLVEKCERESRQLNLGRDGLTHNMLDVIHCHWKRRRVCKIKCKGVPTVDMDNVKFHIEDKTGGKVIYQAGGVLYLFRGRNYNYKDRPQIPLMLWKPVTPLYPKLIQPAPEGLTKDEAHQLRVLGRKVQPMCRLGKNGVYLNLVKDVRAAFKVDELVRIDCRGLNPRDYKKIGAKLKDLVPCVLLSFDKEHILMWKGKQDLSVENVSLLNAPNSEPCLADGESFKQSSVTNEGDDCSICEEKVNISVYETLYSAHASGSDTEEKMCISYSEQESGSMLDYASEEVSTHSSDAEAASVLEATGCQVQFEGANINETVFSSSAKDEDHAFIARMKETDYSSNPGSLKEEKLKVSAEKVNVSLLGDKIPLDMSDVLSECHAIADGKLQRKTASKGPDTTFEEQSKSVNPKLGEDGHKEVVPPEAASLKMGFMHEVVDGLASDEEEVDKSLDNQTDSVVHLDALWDHAFASGMAVELSEEGMDADLIVRKAAQLAKLAPLGPTYTIKLIHKLQLKQYEDRPDDILQIRFGRGRPQRILKKVVKRKSELPTLDVPGMGGLPVDELARLLAPKQTP